MILHMLPYGNSGAVVSWFEAALLNALLFRYLLSEFPLP